MLEPSRVTNRSHFITSLDERKSCMWRWVQANTIAAYSHSFSILPSLADVFSFPGLLLTVVKPTNPGYDSYGWCIHTAVPFVHSFVRLMLSFPFSLSCFSHHPLFLWNYLSLTRIYYICSCVFICIYLYVFLFIQHILHGVGRTTEDRF